MFCNLHLKTKKEKWKTCSLDTLLSCSHGAVATGCKLEVWVMGPIGDCGVLSVMGLGSASTVSSSLDLTMFNWEKDLRFT